MPISNTEPWKVYPLVGIGPIKLGESSESSIAKLGSDYREVRRWSSSENVTLDFSTQLVHVTVDGQGTVVGVSVFRPRLVYVGSVQVLGKDFVSTASELTGAGIDTEINDVGLVCKEFGIGLVEVEGMIDGVEMWQKQS